MTTVPPTTSKISEATISVSVHEKHGEVSALVSIQDPLSQAAQAWTRQSATTPASSKANDPLTDAKDSWSRGKTNFIVLSIC